MRRTKDDRPGQSQQTSGQAAGQQMGSVIAPAPQAQQAGVAAQVQAGGEPPRNVRYTDWASI